MPFWPPTPPSPMSQIFFELSQIFFELPVGKIKFHINSKNIISKNETKNCVSWFLFKSFLLKNAAQNAPPNYIAFEIISFIAHLLNSNNLVLI